MDDSRGASGAGGSQARPDGHPLPSELRSAAVAFTFPGQGSQVVGMWRELGASSELGRRRLDEAEERLGISLRSVMDEGPSEELTRTELAQPCLLLVDVVCGERLLRRGLSPRVVLGHSLGEYAALVLSGSLDFGDAIALVRARGELMGRACEQIPGTMAAVIGADRAPLEDLLERTCGGGGVEIANYNAPGQLVISGRTADVEIAEEAIRAARLGRPVRLAVSAPFHCSLMEPVAELFRERIRQVALRPPSCAFIDNVTGARETDPERIRAKLVEQIHRPVRWEDAVLAACELGAEVFVECGPGRVLTGLSKRIARARARYRAAELLASPVAAL